ncbi:hypothetical protein SAMN05421759_107112 [Roseivivax lentus]|uniref:Uncharacterized protein n=2 Tax=Roseivivax lentus TaxID=633194 RepID=A0A1N7N9T9_9RHOB|nr:hypothetical protein SAMN05421759_107112 [Roseivivax lentus]
MQKTAIPLCLACVLSTPVFAQTASGEAFLTYTRPISGVPEQAYIAQVEKYPAFRPVRQSAPRQSAPAAPSQPQSPAPAAAEPAVEENVILNVGGRTVVVPRARLDD